MVHVADERTQASWVIVREIKLTLRCLLSPLGQRPVACLESIGKRTLKSPLHAFENTLECRHRTREWTRQVCVPQVMVKSVRDLSPQKLRDSVRYGTPQMANELTWRGSSS